MYSPKLDTFLKLAAQGNLIPVTRRILADFETPLSAYQKIRGQNESFLFESVEGGEHLGRYSFVGCNPRAIIRQTGSRVEILENGRVIEEFLIAHGQHQNDPQPSPEGVLVVDQAIKSYGKVDEFMMSYAPQTGPADPPQYVRDGLEVVERLMGKYRAVSLPSLPRFTGGAVGFIGYEFIHDVEPIVPRPSRDDLKTPVMCFLIADELLIFDRVAQTTTILVNAVLENGKSPADAYDDAISEIDRLVSLLEQPSHHVPVTVPAEVAPVPFQSNLTRDQFQANVRKAKEYITSGDII